MSAPIASRVGEAKTIRAESAAGTVWTPNGERERSIGRELGAALPREDTPREWGSTLEITRLSARRLAALALIGSPLHREALARGDAPDIITTDCNRGRRLRVINPMNSLSDRGRRVRLKMSASAGCRIDGFSHDRRAPNVVSKSSSRGAAKEIVLPCRAHTPVSTRPSSGTRAS